LEDNYLVDLRSETGDSSLPLPEHYDANRVGQVWQVPYQKRAKQALLWAGKHGIPSASADNFKIALILIDVQNTFCIPDFELFVAGKSGTGAVDDNRRLCDFIYRNLGVVSHITATMDTHMAVQIFHPVFLVDDNGDHPVPHTQISIEDIESGRWCFNPDIASSLGLSGEAGQRHLLHYARSLKSQGKYDLTIWPYHAMLGGIGHALVPAVEEAIFFHTIARNVQPDLEIKGEQALTEHYSAIGPEILGGENGVSLAKKTDKFINLVENYDLVAIAGQAQSHCVAWTVEDLLIQIQARDPQLAAKVFLLTDCTSPVVIPGVIDFTDQADEKFQHFAQAGMHLVRSIDPIQKWPSVAYEG
jgi:nicotinamidase-related amidase